MPKKTVTKEHFTKFFREQGRRTRAACCPVAQLIREEYPDIDHIIVRRDSITMNRKVCQVHGTTERFIAAVDSTPIILSPEGMYERVKTMLHGQMEVVIPFNI